MKATEVYTRAWQDVFHPGRLVGVMEVYFAKKLYASAVATEVYIRRIHQQ